MKKSLPIALLFVVLQLPLFGQIVENSFPFLGTSISYTIDMGAGTTTYTARGKSVTLSGTTLDYEALLAWFEDVFPELFANPFYSGSTSLASRSLLGLALSSQSLRNASLSDAVAELQSSIPLDSEGREEENREKTRNTILRNSLDFQAGMPLGSASASYPVYTATFNWVSNKRFDGENGMAGFGNIQGVLGLGPQTDYSYGDRQTVTQQALAGFSIGGIGDNYIAGRSVSSESFLFSMTFLFNSIGYRLVGPGDFTSFILQIQRLHTWNHALGPQTTLAPALGFNVLGIAPGGGLVYGLPLGVRLNHSFGNRLVFYGNVASMANFLKQVPVPTMDTSGKVTNELVWEGAFEIPGLDWDFGLGFRLPLLNLPLAAGFSGAIQLNPAVTTSGNFYIKTVN